MSIVLASVIKSSLRKKQTTFSRQIYWRDKGSSTDVVPSFWLSSLRLFPFEFIPGAVCILESFSINKGTMPLS